MFRWRKLLVVAAVAAAAGLLGGPSAARANITVVVHETGFADQTFTLPSGGPGTTGPQTIGQYSFQVNTNDSAPGINPAQGGAVLTQNTLSVTATTAPTADLVITVSDNTFTNFLPGAASTVKNSLSTTEIDAGTVSAFGFVNTQANATPSVSLTGPTLSGSASSSAGLPLGAGATFTLGSVATIHNLGAGATDNITVTELAAVPAPASLVAAFTGLPLLGIGSWLRRRKQA